VAVDTLRGGAAEPVARMAAGTLGRTVSAGERETRQRMIETSTPLHRAQRVARGAVRPDPRCSMRRSDRGLELLFVAAVTFDRDVDVFVLLLILMALFTGRRQVRTNKRKPGLRMPLGHVGNQPGLRRMAPLAGKAQFSPVNVPMTALAFQRRTRKPESRMAGKARHRCVLTVQRELCRGMLEF
jgi:hypothetical protein